MKNLSKYLVSNEDIESSQTTIFGETQEIDSENAIASTAGDLTEVTQIEGSPVEEVPIADDAVTPIDFDTQVNILEPLAEQARVEDAAVALEAYRQLIKDAGPDGISRQAAAFMAVGMAQIDKALGIEKSQFTAALESYDSTPRSAIQRAAEVSVEAIGEKLKEAGKAIIEVIKRIIATIKKHIKEFNPKLIILETRINNAIDKVRSINGTVTAGKDEITFNPTWFQVNGKKFIADDPRVISDLIKRVTVDYMNDLKRFNEMTVRHFKSRKDFESDYETGEFHKRVEGVFAHLVDLPGLQELKIDTTESKKGIYRWTAKHDDEDTIQSKPVTVDIRSPRKILQHLETLRDQLDKLKDFNKADYSLNEQVEEIISKWDPDEANGKTADEALKQLRSGIVDNSELVKYIARCIAAQYQFIVKYELPAYDKKDSKAESDKK